MTGMIVLARESFDQGCDSGQGPYIGLKTVRPRPSAQRLVELLQVFGLEPRFPSGATGSTQSRGTASFPLAIPATYILPAYLQFTSYLRQGSCARLEVPRGSFACCSNA
jgi:hypothetical protein